MENDLVCIQECNKNHLYTYLPVDRTRMDTTMVSVTKNTIKQC